MDLMYAAQHSQTVKRSVSLEITMTRVRFIFTVGALVLSAAAAYAQGGPDFSKVEIKANKVTDKFYTLDGQGGTIGVLIGPDGVFMVDTQFAPLSEKIAAAIKQLTPQPIKFVVNTHLHGDHSGGDENFGKMGATIISREELRFRLAHPNPQANGQPGVPMAAVGLPKQTYREQLTLHMNGEEIQLIAIPRAHTDGDTMVYFPDAKVVMVSDQMTDGNPVIDWPNGGSWVEWNKSLEGVLKLDFETAIQGRGEPKTRADVQAFKDKVDLVTKRASDAIKAGATKENLAMQVKTDDLMPWNFNAQFFGNLYDELKK